MNLLLILLVLLVSSYGVAASSPIAYNVILAIVIVELVFAFSLGVICVIFSFNLLRALKESDAMQNMRDGDFPPSRMGSFSNLEGGTYNPLHPADYSTFHEGSGNRRLSTESEMDVEEEIPGYTGLTHTSLVGIVYSFSGYLRLW